MIISLRCENFRCFKDSKTIELAPLTLLFGENNSGKSAIIQALHLPAHTLQSEGKETPLALAGMNYDYGSYSDVVFRHDENELITFSYGTIFPLSEKEQRLFVLRVDYGYLPRRREIYLNSLIIEDSEGEIIRILYNKYTSSIKSMYLRSVDSKDLSYFSRLISRFYFLLEPIHGPYETHMRLKRKYGKELGEKLFGDLIDVLSINRDFSRCFRRIHHLGPLRIPARRTLLYTGSSFTGEVGSKGEITLQNYSALLKRRKKEDKKKINLINSALYRLGFIKKFEIYPIGTRHYEFWTRHSVSMLRANLADTGFGTSQVLPVLFSLYATPEDSTLLYEQPEIHLHPAAQAELGSVFAEACSPRKRIIIETHSENLILRIQTELAKGNLKPKDVRVYYIQPKKGGHRVINLPLNEKGEFLKKWPKGFFEEGYKESLKLIRAQAKS